MVAREPRIILDIKAPALAVGALHPLDEAIERCFLLRPKVAVVVIHKRTGPVSRQLKVFDIHGVTPWCWVVVDSPVLRAGNSANQAALQFRGVEVEPMQSIEHRIVHRVVLIICGLFILARSCRARF